MLDSGIYKANGKFLSKEVTIILTFINKELIIILLGVEFIKTRV